MHPVLGEKTPYGLLPARPGQALAHDTCAATWMRTLRSCTDEREGGPCES